MSPRSCSRAHGRRRQERRVIQVTGDPLAEAQRVSCIRVALDVDDVITLITMVGGASPRARRRGTPSPSGSGRLRSRRHQREARQCVVVPSEQMKRCARRRSTSLRHVARVPGSAICSAPLRAAPAGCGSPLKMFPPGTCAEPPSFVGSTTAHGGRRHCSSGRSKRPPTRPGRDRSTAPAPAIVGDTHARSSTSARSSRADVPPILRAAPDAVRRRSSLQGCCRIPGAATRSQRPAVTSSGLRSASRRDRSWTRDAVIRGPHPVTERSSRHCVGKRGSEGTCGRLHARTRRSNRTSRFHRRRHRW